MIRTSSALLFLEDQIMDSHKLKWALICILGIVLCAGHVVKAETKFSWSWSNDECENATPIEEVVNLAFDTTDATFDGPGHCMSSPNIWYHYTAACTGSATVSLCGSSSLDTVLAVYRGSECYPQQQDMIGCNDDACGRQSELIFDVVAGNQYLIEVGGFGDQTGEGVLSIRCEKEDEEEVPNLFDLGDAPDSSNNFGKIMTAYPTAGPKGVRANYPTVFNDSSGVGPYGPIHLRSLEVAHLGEGVTGESEADTGFDQDGVNNIIPSVQLHDRDQADDGVLFPLNLPDCRWATFDYLVNVIQPDVDLWVNVWCDWNRDGDWNDDSNTDPALSCSKGTVSEWAVRNQFLSKLPAGVHQITTPAFLPWHPSLGPKEIWMRIILTEQPWRGGSGPGGSGPQEGYEFGETEDYYFAPDTSSSICEDINGDGVINMQDLAMFVDQWLEFCP